jgi:dUTPase
LNLGVKKPRGSEIDWFNRCGNYATHFVDCIESPNVVNSSYNCKKIITTSKVGPTMCVSFSNDEKTQVRWVAAIG